VTDWCTADWNTLTTSLGLVDWRVHSAGEKDWVDYCSAFLTLLIAALALLIAYRQWRTSEKERLAKIENVYMDCYYKIVEALYIFAHNATGDTETSEASLEESGKLMIDAYGLAILRLDREVADYALRIRDEIFRAKGIRAMAYGLKPFTAPNSEQREKLINIHLQMMNERPWEFFSKYMPSVAKKKGGQDE
jgi:hypothetical protein